MSLAESTAMKDAFSMQDRGSGEKQTVSCATWPLIVPDPKYYVSLFSDPWNELDF